MAPRDHKTSELPSPSPPHHNHDSSFALTAKKSPYNMDGQSQRDYPNDSKTSKNNKGRPIRQSLSKNDLPTTQLEDLRLLFRFKKDQRIETVSKGEFLNRIAKRNATKIFCQYSLFQRAIYNSKGEMSIYKVKFSYGFIEDDELFERSIIESRVLNDRCPKTSLYYISREQEAFFMEELMRERVRSYC